MSDDLKRRTREWFRRVWDEGEEGAIDEMLAGDVKGWGLPEGPFVGRAGFKAFWGPMRAGFDGAKVRVEEVVAEGDVTVARIAFEGKHAGEVMGFKATQRPVRVTGIVMMRWRDGRIVEAWNEFDAAGMARQIGG